MQATQTVPPQAVQVQMTAQVPSSQRSRYSCGATTFGILQIVLCGLSVVLGVIIIVSGYSLNIFGFPLWGALLFYLPAGILGILSVVVSQNSRRCVAMASLVMCILAAIMAFFNTGISVASAVSSHGSFRVTIALNAVLSFLAFVEMVIAILASVFSSMVMREYADVTPSVQYVTQGYPHTVAMNPNAAPNMYPTGNAPMYATGNAPMYATGNAPMYATGNAPMNTAVMAQPQPAPVYSASSSGGFPPAPTADYGEKTGNLP